MCFDPRIRTSPFRYLPTSQGQDVFHYHSVQRQYIMFGYPSVFLRQFFNVLDCLRMVPCFVDFSQAFAGYCLSFFDHELCFSQGKRVSFDRVAVVSELCFEYIP
jgi:hypothetical protein